MGFVSIMLDQVGLKSLLADATLTRDSRFRVEWISRKGKARLGPSQQRRSFEGQLFDGRAHSKAFENILSFFISDQKWTRSNARSAMSMVHIWVHPTWGLYFPKVRKGSKKEWEPRSLLTDGGALSSPRKGLNITEQEGG